NHGVTNSHAPRIKLTTSTNDSFLHFCMMVTSFTKADPRSQTPSLISGESGTLFQASVCAMRKRAALLTAVRELIRPQAIPFAIGCPPPPDRKTTDRHISPAAVDFRPIVLRSRRAA